MSFPPRLAVVDLETTGAHLQRDGITEIAIIRIEHGEVVERWETLVNPGRPIPPNLQQFIGITDEMVAGAPSFAEVADKVQALLADTVFVAHNARFDYGFLKNALGALDRRLDLPVMCTIKLSRALFPQHHRHGLDALIERHGLVCEARHRAMGDTDALLQFIRLVEGDVEPDVLRQAVERAMKAPARPPGLPEGAIEGMPDTPGLYLFFASEQPPEGGRPDVPIHIGRAASLRTRVIEHLSAAGRNGKDGELVRQVRRVDWIETAGELSSLLLEIDMLRDRQPLSQRLQRPGDEAFALRVDPARRRPPVLERVRIGATDPGEWVGLYGAFGSRKEADNLLRELAMAYQLCPQRLGIEPVGKGACAAYRQKQCAGVCAGKEKPEAHDTRLLGALESVRLKPWPWPGAVRVVEHQAASGLLACHVFDQGCYLGTTDMPDEASALCAGPRRFDLDRYRMLMRWLAVPANRERVELIFG